MLKKGIYQYRHAKGKYTNFELAKKVNEKLYKKIYHSLNRSRVENSSLKSKKRKVGNFVPSHNFFFDIKDKKKYIDYLDNFNLTTEVIEQANEVCNHNFNLLGSGRTFLGSSINWHEDFKTGYVWPKKYYYNISTINFLNDADVKVPWELSRFQHIPTLGQAYWLTNNDKYAIEFKNQIEDWIKENPIGIGVNWTCTMDVSIRSINWMIGYHYFKDSKEIKVDFWERFYNHLYETGEFIVKNLERYINGHGNNHYLTNLVGLTWLGIFFGNYDKKTIKWLNIGKQGLLEEMKYQVNTEGTNFEASISYHRLVTEMLLSTTILMEKNKMSFSSEFKTTLEKMCEFVMYYTKPNGLAPQIGDADDGRLHIFTKYGLEEKRDHRHILSIAGEFFNRDDFRYFSGKEKMEAVWLLGKAKKNIEKQELNLLIKSYNQMGFYIIRDERIYLILRCGNVGQAGMGGHSHNDQLSIELQIDGHDVFVDPGTYLYTANYKERNKYRSTGYHSTLQVNGDEQNLIEDKQLFRLYDSTKSKVTSFTNINSQVSIECEHQGYLEKYGVIHKRFINYRPEKNEIVIKDFINKEIKSQTNWIFSDTVSYQKLNRTSVLINKKVLVEFNDDIEFKEIDISSSYGKYLKSKKAEVNIMKENEVIINFKNNGLLNIGDNK